MPEVGFALFTQHFRARHAVRFVGFEEDVVRDHGVPKTRPAGAGIEFGFGREERVVAGHAVVGAGLFVVQEVAGAGHFGAFKPADAVLLFGEFIAVGVGHVGSIQGNYRQGGLLL